MLSLEIPCISLSSASRPVTDHQTVSFVEDIVWIVYGFDVAKSIEVTAKDVASVGL